ncbi:MAG: hypothetical protein MUE46_10415 [Xanthomonadales bacterium]|jgi:hypothetical protein|nr:hypothetical protein [Xanthomonadales bacterium]
MSPLNALKAWIAGFLATLLFHQTALWLLVQATGIQRAVWSMAPTAPLGVPQVISLAFWGGVWGIALLFLLRGQRGGARYGLAALYGALLPSIIALLVVFPLKGQGFEPAMSPQLWIAALLLNGAWGLGTALFLSLQKVDGR